ncbi:MAG TPA: DUF4280 domain-containing protein [Acidimicrobiales bacterium]|jgi:hypothetical protein|nr:DUF4280 domain-containing protein [Acidimicrobiales bacterium]
MPMPSVVQGALLQCSFGMAPASLNVLPVSRVMVTGMPAADITCTTPVNIPTFGMCMSLANPEVAAATSAALGVLTPMPCIPVIPAPWAPGAPTTMVGGKPALVAGSTCICAYGGAIQITNPGATKTLA